LIAQLPPPWLLDLAVFAASIAMVVLALGFLTATRYFSQRRVAAAMHLAGDELAALFVFVDPQRVARASAFLLLAAPVVVLTLGGPVWLLLVALGLWLATPALLLRWLRQRRCRRFEAQLPEAVMSLAAQLRAGLALGQALNVLAEHQAAPLGQELMLVLRRHRLGLALDAALAELPLRVRSRDAESFVAALRIARETGAGLADALQRLGDTLRRRRMIEDRIRALTAQGRTQGVVVSLLPAVLVLALLLLEPDATGRLFSTPAGWAALATVVALEIAGWLLIRRIVNIDV
jgi:tight adherence protein B